MIVYRLCKFNVVTEELVESITLTETFAKWLLTSKLGDLEVLMSDKDVVDLCYSDDKEYVYELYREKAED
jgi:hypothetical protein